MFRWNIETDFFWVQLSSDFASSTVKYFASVNWRVFKSFYEDLCRLLTACFLFQNNKTLKDSFYNEQQVARWKGENREVKTRLSLLKISWVYFVIFNYGIFTLLSQFFYSIQYHFSNFDRFSREFFFKRLSCTVQFMRSS